MFRRVHVVDVLVLERRIADEVFQRLQGFVIPLLDVQRLTVVVVGLGARGFLPDDGLILLQRVVDLAGIHIGVRQTQTGLGVVGVDADGLLPFGDRILETAFILEYHAQVIAGVGVIRINEDRLLEFVEGLFVL